MIKLVKTHPDAVLPTANNTENGTGDTGFDLVAVETVPIPLGDSAIVPVGLTLADIDPGYWIRIEPRSGLGFKHSLQPHLGVIDNGYRGDLAVKMYNFHARTNALIKKGQKIAQLVVYPLLQPRFEFTDSVTDTARGAKGFGSSDSVSAADNTVNVESVVQADKQDVNPWTFTNVEELLKWCKSNREIVDNELFQDLLTTTQNNRNKQQNV